MTWTYNLANLGTTTDSERLDAVRFLVGDTNTNDPQVQDEEIAFALAQKGNNIYSTAALVARGISAKFSRLVDVELDGQLSESYSQLQKHYKDLSVQLDYQAKSVSGGLGIAAGGISKATMSGVESQTDRAGPRIRRDQFSFFGTDYTGDQ